jgi:alanyl-tRNA synthetase
LQEDAKAAQRMLRSFQEKLATHEATALLSKGAVVVEAVEGWDAQGIKAIAAAATTANPDSVVILFTAATPAQVVVARGAKAKVDAGALLKQLAAKFGGKGGGKPDLAQGGGLNGSSSDLLAAARTLVGTGL